LYESAAEGRRFSTLLFGLFALLALSLVCAGVFGVMSYHVAQRRREMGIRLALGAARSGVLGLVLGRSLRLAMIGTALGLIGALATARVTQSVLFEVGPMHPLSLGLTTLLLLLVGLLAAIVPALRAVAVDPLQVLHEG
jgi:ABC-type antimicrobial peptide transport system permease subunit